MYHAENVTLLRKLYEWSIVDASDIDEVKYTISKKFSEVSFRSFFSVLTLTPGRSFLTSQDSSRKSHLHFQKAPIFPFSFI